jgi:hypothetical protein
MPRFRLVWLEIADQQYRELPDATRALINRRLAQLVENPTADADADYHERVARGRLPVTARSAVSKQHAPPS